MCLDVIVYFSGDVGVTVLSVEFALRNILTNTAIMRICNSSWIYQFVPVIAIDIISAIVTAILIVPPNLCRMRLYLFSNILHHVALHLYTVPVHLL